LICGLYIAVHKTNTSNQRSLDNILRKEFKMNNKILLHLTTDEMISAGLIEELEYGCKVEYEGKVSLITWHQIKVVRYE